MNSQGFQPLEHRATPFRTPEGFAIAGRTFETADHIGQPLRGCVCWRIDDRRFHLRLFMVKPSGVLSYFGAR